MNTANKRHDPVAQLNHDAHSSVDETLSYLVDTIQLETKGLGLIDSALTQRA
jgi:hypothetical protein